MALRLKTIEKAPSGVDPALFARLRERGFSSDIIKKELQAPSMISFLPRAINETLGTSAFTDIRADEPFAAEPLSSQLAGIAKEAPNAVKEVMIEFGKSAIGALSSPFAVGKEEVKIPYTNTTAPTFLKTYNDLRESGLSPFWATVGTTARAAGDVLILDGAFQTGKFGLSQVSKIPIERAKMTTLTRKDLIDITRGEEFAGKINPAKKAAYNRLTEDGVSIIELLRKSEEINVKTGKAKTLGEALAEQAEAVMSNQEGFILTPKGKKLKLERLNDNIKYLENQSRKADNKMVIKRLDKAMQNAILERNRLINEQPLSNQGGFARIPGKLKLSDKLKTEPLTKEIQKAKSEGKSFEEFTKGQQQVFRGGSVFDPKKIGDDGISLTTSSERAKFFTSETQGKGGEKGRIVQEFFIDKKVNIAQQKDIPVNLWKTIEPDDISKWAKENKFDGVDLRNLGGSIAQADKEIRIFNPAIIKTKSQLKQLWDKGGKTLESSEGLRDEELIISEKEIATKTEIVEKTEQKKIPDSIYEENRKFKRSLKKVVKQDVKSILANISKGIDKYLGSISTRLKNINPEIKRSLRTFEFNIRNKTLKDTKAVKPFLDATKKMSKEDAIDFDLARKNGDADKIDELSKKYNIEKETIKVRETLDSLYKRAEEANYNIQYRKNYYPRVIKDKVGFINYFRNGEDWGSVDQAIKAKENALQRSLSEDEKILLINTMIRGYAQNSISLSEIGNMKTREIDIINAELNQFYMDSNASLVNYITKANEAIEAKKFFGKGRFNEEVDINDSIGAYILDLMADGKITPSQEVVVSDILKARFNAVGTRGAISVYKNLSYVDTMGSVTSAITQIGDLTWSIYKTGYIKTAKNYIKSAVGKSTIKREDIGIENIAQEFDDPTKSAKAVNKVFKLVGLEKIDAMGKETLINSVIEKYQRWAEKGDIRLEKSLEPVFGKEQTEIIADLKSGYITENVKLLAFNELLDMQPVALSEMPQKYLTGGNGRLFYMLKTFTLKQFDIYRREIFQQLLNKGTRLQGLKNMLRLVSAFIIMNAVADEIKDFILGRKTSLKDRTVDNILRAVGFSKYLTWKVRTEGLGSGLVRQILPPFKFIDSVSKDILKGVENGSEVTQSVPIGGKLYYWWFGKGAYKNKPAKAKDTKGIKLKLNTNKLNLKAPKLKLNKLKLKQLQLK